MIGAIILIIVLITTTICALISEPKEQKEKMKKLKRHRCGNCEYLRSDRYGIHCSNEDSRLFGMYVDEDAICDDYLEV